MNDDSIPSINCKSFDAFIVDYIDDNLKDEEKKIFIRHLIECAPCKKYLEDYQNSIALSEAAFSNDEKNPKKEIPEQLVNAILAARQSAK